MTSSVPEVPHSQPGPAPEIGDMLVGADGVQILVLDASEDGAQLLVMTLPEG